ncbi:MAG: class I SAM-dependent methyltransferase [Minisyncoccota bacterium]
MPSQAYETALAEAAAHHATSKTYSGKFLRPHKPALSQIIADLGVVSALDYGCGKCAQYEWVDPSDEKTMEQAWGFPVTKYDPACLPFATEPVGKFDLVICTHTLGTIPVEDMDWVFQRIFGFAEKVVYFAEKIGPVKKNVFSDPSVLPMDWSIGRWMEAVKPHAKAFAGETHFAFRYRDEDGAFVDRHRYRNGRWSKKSNRP